MRADLPPQLFTFGLNKTLADIDGLSHVERICHASPLPRAEVDRVLRDELGLKTMPALSDLTDEVIDRTCTALRIDRRDFPFGSVPPAPYQLRPDAYAAVAAAAQHLPVAVITNTSVFADPGLKPVSTGLAPHLSAIHCSWAMGYAKPAPQAFIVAAAFHKVTAHHLIHIGDSWFQDVAPVLALGGRAVWLNHNKAPVPGSDPVPPGRLLVANNLTEAVNHAISRWLAP